MDYHWVIKKNEILPFVTTGMGFKGIMWSELSQSEEVQIPHDVTYIWDQKQIKKTPSSQTQKTDQALARGKEMVGGKNEWRGSRGTNFQLENN